MGGRLKEVNERRVERAGESGRGGSMELYRRLAPVLQGNIVYGEMHIRTRST